VYRMVHSSCYDGPLKPHTSAVRPSLLETDMPERVFFCLEETRDDGLYKERNNRVIWMRSVCLVFTWF
jgi:hypothetical protein